MCVSIIPCHTGTPLHSLYQKAPGPLHHWHHHHCLVAPAKQTYKQKRQKKTMLRGWHPFTAELSIRPHTSSTCQSSPASFSFSSSSSSSYSSSSSSSSSDEVSSVPSTCSIMGGCGAWGCGWAWGCCCGACAAAPGVCCTCCTWAATAAAWPVCSMAAAACNNWCREEDHNVSCHLKTGSEYA